MTPVKIFFCLLATIALGGCASRQPHVAASVVIITPPADLPAVDRPMRVEVPGAAAVTAPVAPGAPTVTLVAPPRTEAPALPAFDASPRLELAQTIYFAFDAYKIAPRYQAELASHAEKLKSNPRLRVQVRAYADERGAEDYNAALSKKRAQTVARFLSERGASQSQIVLVHHGEASSEQGDAAERRVELLYIL